jgi:hypothetical protein
VHQAGADTAALTRFHDSQRGNPSHRHAGEISWCAEYVSYDSAIDFSDILTSFGLRTTVPRSQDDCDLFTTDSLVVGERIADHVDNGLLVASSS